MIWLVPLGFLGLIGLVILLIIYIIKPNYQKKYISSTYVWKLSLKYRKRRNPINKFQDLLLLLCQICAIIACSLVLAQPALADYKQDETPLRICVIDASVSMLAEKEGITRFERAVSEIKTLAEEVTAAKGEITVILADEEANYVTVRTKAETLGELNTALEELVTIKNVGDQLPVTHGDADIKGAMDLAEEILVVTPRAEVWLYTGKEYYDTGNVVIKDVGASSEYNVAILDVQAECIENYYTFNVDVACYGRDIDVQVFCEIYGVNDDPSNTVKWNLTSKLTDDLPKTLEFKGMRSPDEGGVEDEEPYNGLSPRIFSYEYAYFYVREEDSLAIDNEFYVYGGTREVIRIQYCSDKPNVFFRNALNALRDATRKRWDFYVKEVQVGEMYDAEPETKGFDFYIFEHAMPRSVPNDGVVWFVNPEAQPYGTGIDLGARALVGNLYLSAPEEHPINSGMYPERILVTQCREVRLSDDYTVVLECHGSPAFAVRNDDSHKIAIMSFEVQNSDLSLYSEWCKLFLQSFNYFFPSTVTSNNFEVGQSVTLNARAPSLSVQGHGMNFSLTEFPATIKLDKYGSYTLSQLLITGDMKMENIYVKIPNAESDFATVLESVPQPYNVAPPDLKDYDLILYFAGALVLLLFLEWMLLARTQ